MATEVPRSVRVWFITHFVVDWAFALPLFLAPQETLRLFGWITVDPVSTRLVSAALMAIGGRSFLMRDASLEHYRELLWLKVIWSLTALLGLVVSAVQGAPPMTWAFAGFFALFSIVWLVWAVRLRVA